MRVTLLLICASALLALGGTAQAGDRYGAPGASAASARAPDWDGPLLNWSNKPAAANTSAAAAAAAAPPAAAALPVRPEPASDWAKRASQTPANPPPAQSVARPATVSTPQAAKTPALPTSLYDAPHGQAVAAAAPASQSQPSPRPAPDPYHPVRPTGEVVTVSLADLPPPGPSLERQQAADEDAQVLAAQIARANAQAVQDRAAGRPVPNMTTDLLGGPQ